MICQSCKEAAAREVENHWLDRARICNQWEQAQRSAAAIRALPTKEPDTPAPDAAPYDEDTIQARDRQDAAPGMPSLEYNSTGVTIQSADAVVAYALAEHERAVTAERRLAELASVLNAVLNMGRMTDAQLAQFREAAFKAAGGANAAE